MMPLSGKVNEKLQLTIWITFVRKRTLVHTLLAPQPLTVAYVPSATDEPAATIFTGCTLTLYTNGVATWFTHGRTKLPTHLDDTDVVVESCGLGVVGVVDEVRPLVYGAAELLIGAACTEKTAMTLDNCNEKETVSSCVAKMAAWFHREDSPRGGASADGAFVAAGRMEETLLTCMRFYAPARNHRSQEVEVGSLVLELGLRNAQDDPSLTPLQRYFCIVDAAQIREEILHLQELQRFTTSGAVKAEWLECSRPTKANRVQYPVGPLLIFASGSRAGRCHWSAGFLGDLPFPLPLHSGAAPFSPHFALVGSQELVLNGSPNFSTLLIICVIDFHFAVQGVSRTWHESLPPCSYPAHSIPAVILSSPYELTHSACDTTGTLTSISTGELKPLACNNKNNKIVETIVRICGNAANYVSGVRNTANERVDLSSANENKEFTCRVLGHGNGHGCIRRPCSVHTACIQGTEKCTAMGIANFEHLRYDTKNYAKIVHLENNTFSTDLGEWSLAGLDVLKDTQLYAVLKPPPWKFSS
ncbi:hypothetical protein PR048_000633 [Dryococelus australis]|uniref:Uncharacterized protein n=1 Tax=Dryococelus australis TaxID=614101 RepID=A0ABQ9IF64_9NEOP|nr:hypothetical protein PR048_000633 [Dryococelus australis]